LSGCPEIAIGEPNAKAWLTALQNVLRHYPLHTSQKAADWGAFVIVSGMIYVPIVVAIRQRLNGPGPGPRYAPAPVTPPPSPVFRFTPPAASPSPAYEPWGGPGASPNIAAQFDPGSLPAGIAGSGSV